MDENVLSEDEIAALAGSVSRGEIAVGAGAVQVGEIQIYDFMKPEHVLKATLPVMDLINQQFSKNYQVGLLGLLHKSVEILPEEMQLIKYGDYINSLSVTPCVSRMTMKPLEGNIFFNIDALLAYSVIDAFFGGSGEVADFTVDKEFTHVERRVIQRMLTLAVKTLKDVWEIAAPVDFKFVQYEPRHQFGSLMDSGELVFISKFICKISKDKNSWIHICLPHSLIEPLKPVLYGGSRLGTGESNKEWLNALLDVVQGVQIEIKTVIAESNVPLKQVLNATEGDFIPLNMQDQAITYAGEIPLFKARMGVSGAMAAIQFSGW